jgi:undecaprenyl-diphosphatase
MIGWMQAYHPPGLDLLMTWMTTGTGGGLVWLTLGALALLHAGYRAAAWRVMLAVALSYALVDALLEPVIAFPSSHATASFASAVTVSRMWPGLTPLWWTLALVIGYSRIYFGYHDPLGILGSALLGIGVGWWVLGGRRPPTKIAPLPHPRPATTS